MKFAHTLRNYDKKNLGKTLRIILLKQIGKCFIENASVGWFEDVGAFL